MENDLESYMASINPWWLTDRIDSARGKIKREDLEDILEDMELNRIIQLLGPRRAGKTTMMYLIMDHLLSQGVQTRDILYLSLDDPVLQTICEHPISDPIDRFLERIAGEDTRYIFLDEIQDIDGWYKWLKGYHDRKTGLKFIISGSSSLRLQEEANTYLRGRVISFVLYPLSFREFIEISANEAPSPHFKDGEIELLKGYSSVSRLLEEYLIVGGFPEWFEIDPKMRKPERWFRMLYEDVPKKAFYEDVVKRFNIRNPKAMEVLFAFIAQNQSRVLSYESMNRVVGLDRATLLDYIQFLTSTYLLIVIGLWSEKLSTTEKAKKKYLVLDQGIRNGILREYNIGDNNLGFIVENVVGVYLHRLCEREGLKLSHIRSNGEVDFVVSSNERSVPVEVKTSDKFSISREMKDHMRTNGSPHGVVITKRRAGEFRSEGLLFRAVPLWVLLTGVVKREIWI